MDVLSDLGWESERASCRTLLNIASFDGRISLQRGCEETMFELEMCRVTSTFVNPALDTLFSRLIAAS